MAEWTDGQELIECFCGKIIVVKKLAYIHEKRHRFYAMCENHYPDGTCLIIPLPSEMPDNIEDMNEDEFTSMMKSGIDEFYQRNPTNVQNPNLN